VPPVARGSRDAFTTRGRTRVPDVGALLARRDPGPGVEGAVRTLLVTHTVGVDGHTERDVLVGTQLLERRLGDLVVQRDRDALALEHLDRRAGVGRGVRIVSVPEAGLAVI